jgi:hypothetical protein
MVDISIYSCRYDNYPCVQIILQEVLSKLNTIRKCVGGTDEN